MDIVKLCLNMGASKAEKIPVAKLTFSPELRELCEQNACGKYGQNYCCPPFVGEIHSLINRLKEFQFAVIWQNIYPLEDSFDFEGMIEAQNSHNSMTNKIAKIIYDEFGNTAALLLGAGSCSFCDICGAEVNEPCHYPEKALPSLESYGINVSKISDVSDMKYINGENTVTYFSGAFLRIEN